MIRPAALSLAFALTAFSAATSACEDHAPTASSMTQPEPVAVMYGGEVEYDACGAWGDVHGLDPNGDNFLAVRTGPGTAYTQIDSLNEGDGFSLCDRKGSWIGIVYQDKDQKANDMEGDVEGNEAGDLDCNTGTPVTPRKPYDGPCRSGWVHENWVRLLAG